jgi:nucleotide-binding universal stress UspA family protein
MLRRLVAPVLLLPPREPPPPCEFGHILVALDGEFEGPLIDTAIALNGSDPGRRWVLTRVVEPTVPLLSGLAARPGRIPPDWTKRREIEARNYLARVADGLRARGLDVSPQVLVGRGVARQLLELAGALGADCIVVGTHGAGGMERVLLGSVADKVVRGAEIPVLIVPAAAERAQGP